MNTLTLLPVALFVVWLSCEFGEQKVARRVAGCVLGLAACLAFVVASAMARFEANAYCNGAASKLLRSSVEQLEKGRTEAVLRAWQEASKSIDGGPYEVREDFAGAVDAAVQAMRK